MMASHNAKHQHPESDFKTCSHFPPTAKENSQGIQKKILLSRVKHLSGEYIKNKFKLHTWVWIYKQTRNDGMCKVWPPLLI